MSKSAIPTVDYGASKLSPPLLAWLASVSDSCCDILSTFIIAIQRQSPRF